MTRAAAFTAELVRTSARGLAGLTAALLYQRASETEARYGEDGFESWRKTLTSRLESLAAALDAGDPKIFADDLRWFRGISSSRGIPIEDLGLALSCMDETVKSQLPEETAAAVAPYFNAAAAALEDSDEPDRGLTEGSPADELFQLALMGDLGGARHYLIDAIKSERLTLESAILKALLPAAREAGRRWHLGEMGVAAEHVITATLRSALHSLTAVLPRPEPNGKAAFIAAVPGDAHDTGLVALALLLEQDGWRVALAGADTPTEEVDDTAEAYQCDLIALSATLPSQRHALTSYLSQRKGTLPVLVGGSAVKDLDDALAMGAEGYAADLPSGVRAARAIVDLA